MGNRFYRGMSMMACAAMTLTGGKMLAEEFAIGDETPYKEIQLPAAVHPAGPLLTPVPADWKVVPLDGEWKFRQVPFVKNPANPLDDEGVKGEFFTLGFDEAQWKTVNVPVSWYQHEKGKPDFVEGKIGWYRKSVMIDAADLADGKRVVIDFRGVADQADVWVNGKKAGERHVGRLDSFHYDITPLLAVGMNTIAVRVYDYVGHTEYWRRNIGGVYAPVRLLVIPSAVYCHRMMVTPLLDTSSVEVRAQIVNSSDKPVELAGVAEIAEWGGGKVVAKTDLAKAIVNPGAQWVELGEIKLDKPDLWSPENPRLYSLSLKSSSGATIGMTRFGYREFAAAGEWLTLNRLKFKPRAFTFSLLSRQSINYNVNAEMERLLRHFKERGVNMIRPHSGEGMLPETFYNLCDEIGLLVYLDWTGPEYHHAYDLPWKKSIMESWPSFEALIKDLYSHPSLCMFSLCNEIYEAHENLYFSEDLDKMYGLVKALDRQNRPVCSSTGRQTLEAMRAGVNKERTDVLDDHQYRGAYCGSWQENITHINNYAAMALKYYKEPKPKIDCEYGVPGDCARYRGVTKTKIYPVFQMDTATAEFKRKYIELLQDTTAEVGWFVRLKMNYCAPRQYLEEAPCRKLYATRHFKRPVEIYRQAGTKCLGGHTNAQWYDDVGHTKSTETIGAVGIPNGPVDISKDYWFAMPLDFELQRLYNPTLVTAGVFNYHPLPGSTQKVEVYVTNDLNEAAEFKVAAQLRLDGKVSFSKEMDFGKLEGMEQKTLMLECQIPALGKTVRGQLEFFLLKGGKRVGDNYYPLTVAEAVELPKEAMAAAKIAVYDSSEVFKGISTEPSTGDVLKAFGVTAVPLKDLAALSSCTHLIIGANSVDKNLIQNAEAVYAWLKGGGKILCFEQSLCGKLPFFPHYTVASGNPGNLLTIVVETHPVFKGLAQDDFDTWAGSMGTMMDYALSPLDEGMVLVGQMAASGDPDAIKSTLCDVKAGKGHLILSQTAATKRVNTDSVARAYLRNLVEYFITGDAAFALALPEASFSKVTFVDDKDALPIDLSKVVNQSFTDDKAEDGQGGWGDFGTGFDEIPRGVSRLQGGVPFRIVDPAANGGKSCLVLKGEKRPAFPDKVEGIPVNASLNSVFLLHTAMYAQPGPVLKYVFHYEDGQTKEFVATNENEIPDWWHPKNRLNAAVVFQNGERGLYMSEFINPMPNNPITSMDIVSYGKSVPFVIAVTGRLRLTSTISGVGEK